MSHPQSWTLSQVANKASGECSVCHAVRQLHHKDGTVHQHGPRHNRCPGSGKPPAVIIRPTLLHSVTTDSPSSSNTTIQPSVRAIDISLLSQNVSTPELKIDHPLIQGNVIKHVPRSARPHCASQLTAVINKVVADFKNISAWSHLLQYGQMMLLAPPRAGRRHNLANVLKKRSTDNLSDSPPVNHYLAFSHIEKSQRL